MDLALNNLQRLICHKTNQTKGAINSNPSTFSSDLNHYQGNVYAYYLIKTI